MARFFYGFFVLLSFLAFTPAFLTHYGVHNDYSIWFDTHNKWLRFDESPSMVTRGRALGAVLLSVPCAFINTVADFAKVRFVSYLLTLLSVGFLIRFFQQRCRLDYVWSTLMAFGILFLPTSQANILWATASVQGPFTFLLSILCYMGLETWRGNKASLIGVFVFFILLLFIYPATVLVVLALTLAKVLFAQGNQWPVIRRQALFDTAFFCIGILSYRLIDRTIVYPIAVKHGFPHGWPNTEYAMEVSNNLAAKLPLLQDIILVSASGTWHPFLGVQGALVAASIISLCALIILIRHWQQRRGLSLSAATWQKTAFFLFLLVMSCMPCLLGGSYFKLTGYRVLLPTASIFIVLLFYIMFKADASFKGMRYLAIALGIAMAVACFWNIKEVSRNYAREYNFIRNQIRTHDLTRVNRYLFFKIPEEKSYIGRPLPFEFNLKINGAVHAKCLTAKILEETGHFNPNYEFQFLNEPFILKLIKLSPEEDRVINLNEAIEQ